MPITPIGFLPCFSGEKDNEKQSQNISINLPLNVLDESLALRLPACLQRLLKGRGMLAWCHWYMGNGKMASGGMKAAENHG